MKRLKVNSVQWLAFAVAVERRLLRESLIAKDGLLECPPARKGETPEGALQTAARAFLRWLALSPELQQVTPPPPKGPGWDGHWAPNRERRRAPRRGIVTVDEPGKTQPEET